MEMTLDNCRMASINVELQQAINSFVRDTVANNNLPWFMMKNALINTLFWVKDEEASEAMQAQNALPQLMQDAMPVVDEDQVQTVPAEVVQEG